jgi:hypothetical protein
MSARNITWPFKTAAWPFKTAAWPFRTAVALLGVVGMLAGAGTATLAATALPDAQGNKQAAKPDKGKDKDKADKKGNGNDATVVVVVDRDGHSRVVREYVTRGNLPPGLAKRRTLPPGLRQQLHEKGTLPPGLRDYWTPVPAEWNGRLPAVPAYYTRYFVERDLIIIDTRNDTLVSLIRDLLN